EKITIEMVPVQTRTMQHGLFEPPSPAPEKLEITLARIRNLIGCGNIGVPELIDTHRANSFVNAPTRSMTVAPRELRKSIAVPSHWRTLKTILRRFRPLCPAKVWCTNETQPVRIISTKGDWRVEACAGPWFTSGDWWTDSWDTEEWDVEIAG